MPEKTFKVNIFEIELPEGSTSEQASFDTAIESAVAQPHQQRCLEVNGKGRRLEHHRKLDNCHLLNFVSLEFAGPGRTFPNSLAKPFDLDSDESFAHETAVLYDTAENLVFAESSLGSIGPGAIATYFEHFAGPQAKYLLIPRLDEQAQARARSHQQIRSVMMRVALGEITALDRDTGISPLKAFGEGFGAEYINIEIKVSRERGRSLWRDSVWNMIRPILSSGNVNNVTQLKVSGREHDDEDLEIIDLIQHREKRERVLQVDDESRKVPHEDRWKALMEVRGEFLA